MASLDRPRDLDGNYENYGDMMPMIYIARPLLALRRVAFAARLVPKPLRPFRGTRTNPKGARSCFSSRMSALAPRSARVPKDHRASAAARREPGHRPGRLRGRTLDQRQGFGRRREPRLDGVENEISNRRQEMILVHGGRSEAPLKQMFGRARPRIAEGGEASRPLRATGPRRSKPSGSNGSGWA